MFLDDDRHDELEYIQIKERNQVNDFVKFIPE